MTKNLRDSCLCDKCFKFLYHPVRAMCFKSPRSDWLALAKLERHLAVKVHCYVSKPRRTGYVNKTSVEDDSQDALLTKCVLFYTRTFNSNCVLNKDYYKYNSTFTFMYNRSIYY